MTRLLGAKGAAGAGADVSRGAGAGAGALTGRAGDIGAERGDSDGEYADPMDEPNGFGPDRLLDGYSSNIRRLIYDTCVSDDGYSSTI